MDSNLILIIFLLFMFGLMWFQNRKRKQQAAQIEANIKVGSKVVLNSGIIGLVVKADERVLTIESAGSKLEVYRGAVRSAEAPVAKAAAAKPAAKAPAKPATAKKPAAKPAAAKKPAAKKTAAK